MGREEILQMINDIGTCEDETERRNMLNSMRDNVEQIFDENDSLSQRSEELTRANEKLRNANTDLFLQLGTKRAGGEGLPGETGEEPPKKTREFEDLFNEKGELK